MSIATQITRLQGVKTDIRNALVEQGIDEAINHNMEDFADDILAIEGGSHIINVPLKLYGTIEDEIVIKDNDNVIYGICSFGAGKNYGNVVIPLEPNKQYSLIFESQILRDKNNTDLPFSVTQEIFNDEVKEVNVSPLPKEYIPFNNVQNGNSKASRFFWWTSLGDIRGYEIDWSAPIYSDNTWMYGVWNSSNVSTLLGMFGNRLTAHLGTENITVSIPHDTHKHSFRVTESSAYIDGVDQHKTPSFTAPTNLYLQLFNRATQGSTLDSDLFGCSNAKLYMAKIYSANSNLIHHFVPCRQISDNAVGLYDLVNNTFTIPRKGTFTLGNEVD